MNRHRYLKILTALAALAWAGGVGLAAAVPSHISYQGVLQDGGTPYTGEANFKFALVDSLTGDYFWTNDGSQGPPSAPIRIPVQDGLFSVLLGAAPMEPIDPSVISNFTRDQALRIWVEFGSHGEVLLGNLPLSSVLFAHQAELARASAGDFAAAGEIWSQSGGFKFPDGTVQETAATSGGGDCLWSAGAGGRIYYNAGNVGIGTSDPTWPLSLERSLASNLLPMALFRTTGANSVASVRFQNALDNHFNLGITGDNHGNHLALGYNANIGLSGDVLRITPEGNVGLGQINPAAKLDVNGSVRMTGLQLGTSATEGHVLTANASGVGTWQAAPAGGGESLWTAGTGGRIYYNDGHVGIGTETPLDKLHLGHIDDSSSFLRITSAGSTGIRFAGESLYDGEIRYDRTDNSMRVHVRSSGSVPERMRITTDGNVGIGTSTPEARLHVNGTARLNGFQLGASATEGHVLTANASGVGTWQPVSLSGTAGGDLTGTYPNPTVAQIRGRSVAETAPSTGQVLKWDGTNWAPQDDEGLSLPYHGTIDSGTHSSSFHVVDARTSGLRSAGRFETSSNWGRAVHGEANATEGEFAYGGYFLSASTGGAGVYSEATAGTGYTYGGFLTSQSTSGWGVFGYATALTGNTIGVNGNSKSNNGTGVYGVAISTTGSTIGVHGQAYSNSPNAYGVFYSGGLGGTGLKSSQMDHPLDPANKYLNHFSPTGPEPLNMYSGNVVMDERGEAIVQLPDYFESINRDFRYQLTCIGGFSPVYIAEEIKNNSFKIAGGNPGLKVSWRVEAVRNDRYMQHRGAVVELEKSAEHRGKYLNPEFYGLPADMGIYHHSTRHDDQRLDQHRTR